MDCNITMSCTMQELFPILWFLSMTSRTLWSKSKEPLIQAPHSSCNAEGRCICRCRHHLFSNQKQAPVSLMSLFQPAVVLAPEGTSVGFDGGVWGRGMLIFAML